MVYIDGKTLTFKGSRGRGSKIFQGGSTFTSEITLIIPLETYRTCDFPGGGLTPHPTPSGTAHDICIQKGLYNICNEIVPIAGLLHSTGIFFELKYRTYANFNGSAEPAKIYLHYKSSHLEPSLLTQPE